MAKPRIPGRSLMKRIVVIGGVAGGMSAATRLRRLDADAEIKTYKIPLTLYYTDDSGAELTKSQVISIQVGKEPDLLVMLDNSDP